MNRQSVSIRPVAGRDATAIRVLSGELGYPSTIDATTARLEKLLDTATDAVFVAEIQTGEIVGWVHVFGALRLESDPFAEIGGLVVAKRHRRRGIGRALLEESRQWARSRDYPKLRIRSRETRTDTHDFLENAGWERCKTQHVFDMTLPR